MTKLRFRAVIVLAILALVAVTAMAKIMPPKPVLPVEANGVRYSADRDGQDQYAVATDIATGKQLWKVKVFHTPIKFFAILVRPDGMVPEVGEQDPPRRTVDTLAPRCKPLTLGAQ